MKTGRKIIYSILVFAGVLIGLVIALWGGEIRTISSVRQVGDNQYLYMMEYKAKYNLDEVIVSDIDENAKLLNYVVKRVGKGIVSMDAPKPGLPESEGDHCTSFQAKKVTGDGYFFGRNYDFFKNPSLVTFSRPKNGYMSVAVSDMSHFGYGLEKLPDSFIKKVLCLASVYAPVDGMNEKGLCTSIMALPKMPAQQSSGKHSVGTTIIMRLFLDRCATVDEALQLLSELDVKHDVKAGSGYHYMVADASGKCAVIEFDPNDGWKTMIVRKPEESNFMHVTNHLLSPKYYTEVPDEKVGNPHSKSWWRYDQVRTYLASRNGRVTFEEAQDCLANVHWKDLKWDNGMVEDTQFSNVYDQDSLILSLRSWYQYDKTYRFHLLK